MALTTETLDCSSKVLGESLNPTLESQYRAGIIGLGRIGFEFEDSHKNAYLQCPQTYLVALCDNDIHKFTPFDQGFLYENYMDMVRNENLDIVSVCTPPETHCQIVCDIAPYVKGIYAEKPIATTLEDADRMIETCHKHGVILQINHQRRWKTPHFRFSRGILNNGSHVYDLINQLFRDDVKVIVEYVDTEEYIFELDCTELNELLIPKGLEHLIYCIETGKQSISSGEEAREALKLCLEFQKLKEDKINAH